MLHRSAGGGTLDFSSRGPGRAADCAPRSGPARGATDAGLLIGVGGLHGQVVRMGPSMLITEAEIDEALARLARACERVDAIS